MTVIVRKEETVRVTVTIQKEETVPVTGTIQIPEKARAVPRERLRNTENPLI